MHSYLKSDFPHVNDLPSVLTVRNIYEENHLVLMCKDHKVFDLRTDQVYNRDLLPGMMRKSPRRETFLAWMQKRYSEKSNTFSRTLRGLVFGQGNRQKIDLSTRALSLSDCYRLKKLDEEVSFFEVSPYFSDFWNGEGYYAGQAIPTLYVNGYLPKCWLNESVLIKRLFAGKTGSLVRIKL